MAPGGRVIRSIIEETGASIDVADDGGVTVSSSVQSMIDLAVSKIEGLTRELVVGDILTGKVSRLTNFGAFIELLPGKDGLVRNEDLGEMEEELKLGQEITVMVREIDSMGRVNVSRRALFGDDGEPAAPRPRPAPAASAQGQDRGQPRPGGGPGGPGGPGGGGDRGRRPGPGGGGRNPSSGGPRPGGPRNNTPGVGGNRNSGGISERRFLGGGGSGGGNRPR